MVLNKFKRLYKYLWSKKRYFYIQGLIKRGLKLGQNVEIIGNFFFDPSHCFLISIGDNCTICPNVRLITHDASTKELLGFTKIGKIEIGKNCFIGDSVIVLPGVSIGDDSIIGAGAVVTKDIASGRIVAGNPAKTIGSVDEYFKKIETMKNSKRIFGPNYYIDRLDENKRAEVRESVGESIGFIV